jgi:hypothetical protein
VTQQFLQPVKEADGELPKVVLQLVETRLKGLAGLVGGLVGLGNGYFGA